MENQGLSIDFGCDNNRKWWSLSSEDIKAFVRWHYVCRMLCDIHTYAIWHLLFDMIHECMYGVR